MFLQKTLFCLSLLALTACRNTANPNPDERSRILDEQKTITINGIGEIEIDWIDDTKTTKATPTFSIVEDASGKKIFYVIDADYMRENFGPVDDEEFCAAYLQQISRRAKNVYGFNVLRDSFFGEDDELLPEIKELISTCRKKVEASENAANLSESEKDFVARKAAFRILSKRN